MRATAALLVFVGHVKLTALTPYANLPAEHQGLVVKLIFGLCRLGHEAVLVFFVLSGFLVGGRIIQRLEGKSFTLASYALERTTRIMLPLVPAVLLTIALDWLVFGERAGPLQALAPMAGLNGVVANTLEHNGPLWSLAYEIWFYLAAGAIAWLIASQRRSFMAFAVLAAAVCVFSVLSARYLLFWCLGACTVFILHNGAKWTFAALGAPLALVGVIAYELWIPAAGGGAALTLTPQPVAEALIAIGVCLTLPLFCDATFNARLAPLRPAAAYLSAVSYSLYLVHYPLNAALETVIPHSSDLSWRSIGLFVGRLVFIFLAANIFYLAFEARTNALRRWLVSQASGLGQASRGGHLQNVPRMEN